MSGVDLEKLKGLQFDVSKVNFEPPRYTIAQSAIDDMNKRTQQGKTNIHIVGDVKKVGNLKTAIWEAYDLAFSL